MISARTRSATLTAEQAGTAKIEFVGKDGSTKVLKDGWPLEAGAVVDASFMSARALSDFLAKQIEETKADGTLFSLHLKATMMKVSDPIIFGHAVRAWLAPVFEKHGDALKAAGVNPNSGLVTCSSGSRTSPRSWRRSKRCASNARRCTW